MVFSLSFLDFTEEPKINMWLKNKVPVQVPGTTVENIVKGYIGSAFPMTKISLWHPLAERSGNDVHCGHGC